VGIQWDHPIPTSESIPSKGLNTTGDSGDTISPLPENPETLMQSCVTPKPQKPQPVKEPIGIGDIVVVAYSDRREYKGIKGEVIAESKLVSGLKGLKVKFDKLIRGISNDIFSPDDLMRFQQ